MSNPSSFEAATAILFDAQSLVDDKLGALAYIESLSLPESLVVLRQAMDMNGLYVSHKDRSNPNLPAAGEIAALAALAIGRLEDIGGIDILLKILISSSESSMLRECAAFGLGGLTSKEAFNAYQQAIRIEDDLVFKMLLRSIELSYRRLDGNSNEYSRQLINSLFLREVERVKNLGFDQNHEIVVSIISSSLDSEQELELAKIIESTNFDLNQDLAIEIMLQRNTEISEQALALVLMQAGHDCKIYSKIANKYQATSNLVLIKAANEAIQSYPINKYISSFFSSKLRSSRKYQIQAAKKIIYTTGFS